ncbi:MAG: protein kinase [Polyangia bacterium]
MAKDSHRPAPPSDLPEPPGDGSRSADAAGGAVRTPDRELDLDELLAAGRYVEATELSRRRGDARGLLRSALLASDLVLIGQALEPLRRASRDEQRRALRLLIEHQHLLAAASLHERLGELDEALALYERAGELLEVARLHEQAGRGPQALAVYRQLAAAAPVELRRDEDPGAGIAAHFGLGRLLLRSGQHEAAIAPLQVARSLLVSARRPEDEAARRGPAAAARARPSGPSSASGSASPPVGVGLDDVEGALIEALCALGYPDVARPLVEQFLARHPEQPQAQAPTEFVARRARHTLTPGGPPTVLGRYRLVRLLGAGGMGRVYLADDQATGRRVALKLLPTPPDGAAGRTSPPSSLSDLWRRFQQEALTLRRLRHPNIVEILDFFPQAGVLVMEHLAGGSLAEVQAPAPLALVQRALLDVIAGLQAAHAAGVLHRDLKPHNLLRTESGQVKIADFGAAQLQQLGATQTESLVGTLAYLSPEQIEGQPLTFAADVYTLGVTLFQLLTGRLPFRGPDFLTQHRREMPPDPRRERPTLPVEWSALCLSLLAKAPSARTGSLDELGALVRSLPTAEAAGEVDSIARGDGGERGDGGALAVATPHLDAALTAPELDASGTGLGGLTLLARTAHSTIHQGVDLRLGRPVIVERFRPGALQGEAGVLHLRWLRALAALGGPGVQRVLRIDSAAAAAYFELPVGSEAAPERPLGDEDAALIGRALHALHTQGLAHGAVRASVVIEPLCATLLVHGRGPLGWPSPPPDAQADLVALAELRAAPQAT